MKVTVWTSWNEGATRKPKCIFQGETEILPRVEDSIVCRDGFGAETVAEVIIDLVQKEAEITVETSDDGNDYGDSLI